jgi:hypothetical protein
MPEFAETAVLDHSGEIDVGLGAIVVLDGNKSGLGSNVCADATELTTASDTVAKIPGLIFFIMFPCAGLPKWRR